MERVNPQSTWTVGRRVSGVYFGQSFTGTIGDDTRPTPDYKNIQFVIILDRPMVVYGTVRDRITLLTNSDDVLYIHD